MQSSASLDRYIQQVRAIPKLSREDEHQLALRVGEGDQAAADKLVRVWDNRQCKDLINYHRLKVKADQLDLVKA